MTPLKDLFSALFFVTIGTLIEPLAIWEHFGTIVLVTAVMMAGKFLACWLGFVLAAVPPAVAVRASLAKVQIGEFGFVIASLALSLGVTNPVLKAVTTGVAVMSIMLTPVAVNQGERIIGFMQRVVPDRLHSLLRIYLDWIEAVRLTLRESSFLRVMRRPLGRVALDFLLLNALLIVGSFLARGWATPPGSACCGAGWRWRRFPSSWTFCAVSTWSRWPCRRSPCRARHWGFCRAGRRAKSCASARSC